MRFTALLALCAATTSAAFIGRSGSSNTTITAEDIIKVAPSATSCDGATAADECATARQAATMIASSFRNFNIDSFGAQAALLALMLYESGDFKYSRNHYPGRPGQGTRNMMMPENVSKYVAWLEDICLNCQVKDVEQTTAQGPAAVLELVNGAQWSFESAAWYLTTQCTPDIKANLASGSQEAWKAYLETCVETTMTDDRTQIYNAVLALKQW